MTKAEDQQLHELGQALEAARAHLDEMLSTHEESWTLDDLHRELERWEQWMRSTTGDEGQPYSPHTIQSHIGHSGQFIRWLTREWQPHGPRSRNIRPLPSASS